MTTWSRSGAVRSACKSTGEHYLYYSLLSVSGFALNISPVWTEQSTWSDDGNDQKNDAAYCRYDQQRYQQAFAVLQVGSHNILTHTHIRQRNEYIELMGVKLKMLNL